MENSDQFSEEKIISGILSGEIALYEIIVRKINPYLYKIGRSYGFDHETTQDIMQETFINAYKNLAKFRSDSKFKTWITRIMLNNCYHTKMKGKYKNEFRREIKEDAEPLFENGGKDTAKVVRSHELRNIIEQALDQIPFKYRMIFSLREINGMNTSETAELLNISESNVKVRLSRAKQMLKDRIERSYSASDLYEFNLIYCDPLTASVMQKIRDLEKDKNN